MEKIYCSLVDLGTVKRSCVFNLINFQRNLNFCIFYHYLHSFLHINQGAVVESLARNIKVASSNLGLTAVICL